MDKNTEVQDAERKLGTADCRDDALKPPTLSQIGSVSGPETNGRSAGAANGCKSALPIADPFGPAMSPQPLSNDKPSTSAAPAGSSGGTWPRHRWLIAAAVLTVLLAALALVVALTSGDGSASAKAMALLPPATWQVPLCGAAAAGQPPCPFPVASLLAPRAPALAPTATSATVAAIGATVPIAVAVATPDALTSAEVDQARTPPSGP